MRIDAEKLAEACSDAGEDSAISIRTSLRPLAGEGRPVKPPTYMGDTMGSNLFQEDQRWWGDPPVRTSVIVLDNVPSQANRLEAALDAMAADLGLPRVVLDLSELELPPHLPRQISGYRFPHRHADAYLRDSMLDGSAFKGTATGKLLLEATAATAEPLLDWFPQSLLFGHWQSHLGKGRSQAKLARSWVSEIVGYDPASDSERTRTLGLKGDPLNLSAEESVVFDEEDLLGAEWRFADAREKAAGEKKKDKLSAIGHGQVPVSPREAALGGVSFRAIEQQSTVSFAGLRRVSCQTAEASTRGRALLVALGLIGHAAAFGRAFSLRSGCDLRPVGSGWTWIGAAAEEEVAPMTLEDARTLLRDCLATARASGAVTGGGWGRDPMVLRPNPSLGTAIKKTYPLG